MTAEIFVEGDRSGEVKLRCRLTDADPQIHAYTLGQRSYRGGRIYTRDTHTISALLDDGYLVQRAAWVKWAETCMRISSFHLQPDRGWIDCTQAVTTGAARIDGQLQALTIIEPSPPRPSSEWLPAERAHAIRELLGAPGPEVQVPEWSDGRMVWVPCDPWAPEYLAGTAPPQ